MNRKFSIFNLFIICFMLITIYSCREEAVVCTDEWVTYHVCVNDSSGNPVILDDYYTQNVSTGEIIKLPEINLPNDSLLKPQVCYILVTDGQGHWAKNGFFNIMFKGFIDSIEVVSEKYTIEADVCHINLLKGNTNIIIK